MKSGEERPKILIVDDEKVNIDVLVGLLRPQYQTVAAKNGEHALKRLEKPPLPDLILLDIMMPGMDGYEVCRKIKSNPKTKEIPIIFITGKNEEKDEARGFQAGAVDYIVKPFSPLIALARVNTHIELKKRGDMLELLAGLDGLTGIPNRRRFDEFLENEWNRSFRHKRNMSVIIMDIDYFKLYNDYYGHTKGDECLKKVAKTISGALTRSEDIAARYGGEEFACILSETDEQGVLAVGERIIESVRSLEIPHEKSDVFEYITLSMGIASCVPAKTDKAVDLIEKADKALYNAKQNGRNRIIIFDKGKLLHAGTQD